MCLYPQHQLISSNVKSKQPIVPAPSGFDMQSPQRWGPLGHNRTLEQSVPMDPHGDSAGVWTLCTPVASSSRPQLQKHRHCSAVAVEIPARQFNFKAIKNPRGNQRNDMAIPGWFAEAVPYGGMSPSVGKSKGWRRLPSNSTDLTQCLPPTAEPSFSNSTSIYNNYPYHMYIYRDICITLHYYHYFILGVIGSFWIMLDQVPSKESLRRGLLQEINGFFPFSSTIPCAGGLPWNWWLRWSSLIHQSLQSSWKIV